MAHLEQTLPPRVELGAIRDYDYSTEIVTTDGGHEVRNARWENPLRSYEISFPTSKRDGSDYLAVKALYDLAKGRLHTFSFKDWTDGTIVTVRFDSKLSIAGVDINHDHIESLKLVEVR